MYMEDEKKQQQKKNNWAEFLVILSNIHKCIKIKQTTWNNQQITNYESFSVDRTFAKKNFSITQQQPNHSAIELFYTYNNIKWHIQTHLFSYFCIQITECVTLHEISSQWYRKQHNKNIASVNLHEIHVEKAVQQSAAISILNVVDLSLGE